MGEAALRTKVRPEPKTTPRQVEILLVEDNPGDVKLLEETLGQSAFPLRLHSVANGEEAITFLRREGSYSQQPRPDFILLDLNLPRKNGLEVLAEIKRNNRFSSIPTLLLTTSNEDEDRWKAYHSRADAYLLKPRDLSQYEALRGYLEKNWVKDILLARP